MFAEYNSHLCRFFPSVYYLSTSKVAIAVLGNFAFAVALCTYFLMTKVSATLLRLLKRRALYISIAC